MNWFYRLRLASKLGITFAAVLALTVLVGLISIRELSKVSETTQRLSAHWMPGTRNEACSNSQPRTPVPMDANRTVSLGATGFGEAHKGFGSSSVYFPAIPAAVAPVPTRIKSRRVQAGCFINVSKKKCVRNSRKSLRRDYRINQRLDRQCGGKSNKRGDRFILARGVCCSVGGYEGLFICFSWHAAFRCRWRDPNHVT